MNQFTRTLQVGTKTYSYYPTDIIDTNKVSKLPISLKILLENLLRHFDGTRIKQAAIQNLIDNKTDSLREISFYPSRILMQDLTGVPAIVDLASMRECLLSQGKNPEQINPVIPVDLVIDHSVMVDNYGSDQSMAANIEMEYQRNYERYQFLKWAQGSFKNLRVIPPGAGICHQVNLEYLAKVVWTNNDMVVYPDTVLGTDSHTTMINGLSVLGWGVGGIEAEAALLGQPISMLIPQVVGVRLSGMICDGCTSTDLVLNITHKLRKFGVVGKFIEFFGESLSSLSVADRATIANMAPEYGATCGFFPIDRETINYLKMSNRDMDQVHLVEAYAKVQGLWSDHNFEPNFSQIIDINLNDMTPTVSGPKRPQDKLSLSEVKKAAIKLNPDKENIKNDKRLRNHDVVIAAITSCTNTSNPSVMIGAGLLARKARALGLKSKPWVKTSLAPGSKVVTEYLEQTGLLDDLKYLRFNIVGYGCTTCIGNSGSLLPHIEQAIEEDHLTVSSILSGNRNFEGRIHPLVKANYLTSPPLVVAYALAGTTLIDLEKDMIGLSYDNRPIYLMDIWPSQIEINQLIEKFLNADTFAKPYEYIMEGDELWKKIDIQTSLAFNWNSSSTYIKNPPYFDCDQHKVQDIKGARILAILGDSITTDHISPAGNIKNNSPAGQYLSSLGIKEFNSYGTYRGNHEVMTRGTFANTRLQNLMTPELQGSHTRYLIDNRITSIYEAAMMYQKDNIPLVVFAGKEYGTGSSRDWAAKGTKLLGIKAIICESFERIHRANLVGMGVLPLRLPCALQTLNLEGDEIINISGLESGIYPNMSLQCKIIYRNQTYKNINLVCCIDTQDEVAYYESGGILPFIVNTVVC